MTRASPGADAGYLVARLAVVEQRVRALVTERRATDPNPDDPFRGLYFNDTIVAAMLEQAPGTLRWPTEDAAQQTADELAAGAEARGERLRLHELAHAFGLTDLDVELLLVALAGDLDVRFEAFYGYLDNDVTRRRPSVEVAFALCGVPLVAAEARARLLHGPLTRAGLVLVDDADRPFAGRLLRVPDRVVGHLLGDDSPDLAVRPLLLQSPEVSWGEPAPLAHALAGGVHLAYLREPATGSGRALAVGALRAIGREVLHVDLAALAAEAGAAELARLVARESRLLGAGLVAGPVEALTPSLLDALTATDSPVLLVGDRSWDPRWSAQVPLLLDVPQSTVAERSALWRAELDLDADLAAATSQFRLRPEQVVRAAHAARVQARLAGAQSVAAAHLVAGARAENGTALERLARRIQPAVGWPDLVLGETVLTSLREVALRARHREQVLGEWRMRPGGGRGHGVAALFAGDSGTGKTMSAEVVAADLGLDLYVVDLATVVDKYVGETEKNLERIFAAAQGVSAVLLFDEADSIFGKRSEVKDAHDRYANIESAYLLQRLESFDGLAVLATNLRANIDDAFTRRLDVVVDFPLPDVEQRRQLWHRCLGHGVPRAADLDLGFCAAAFELAGGAIRSAAVTAGYLAAADGEPLGMAHLVTAVQREYRKLGRLTVASEFGGYWDLVRAAPAAAQATR